MTSNINAFKQNARLGRGINMGNMLEAPRDRSWGEILELKLADFQKIKDQGFDSVRIPTRWSDYTALEAPYLIEPDFFQYVDQVLQAALNAGLAVVLNVHHYEEIFTHHKDHQERLLAMWGQIARHYQSYAPDLMFEVLNEPHGELTASLWNPLVKRAVQVIRAANAERTVLVGPGDWNAIKGLSDFEPPDDPNLILTVHYYLPMRFTHQGAYWVQDSDAWLGTPWEASPEQKKAVSDDFDFAQSWAQSHNLPVYLGEFGAYSRAEMESRARWTEFVTRQAETRGWSWAYWEFCAGFGAYDPERQVWRTALVKALVP